MLFNIDDLCPTNAPRRCIECKGPYHIRKRCPKVLALANEKEKLKRLAQNEQQNLFNNQYNFYRNNPQLAFYPQYYGYQYSFPPQRIWTQPYSNQGPAFSYHPSNNNNNNNSFYRKKQCYACGSLNHIIAQCPSNTYQR